VKKIKTKIMMDRPVIIENRDQLKVEILRLESLKKKQELIIENNIRELKESFRPSNLIPDAISSMLAKKNGDEASTPLKLLNMGVVYLAENLFLKRSPKLVKAAVAYAVGNVTSNALADKSTSILNGIRSGLKGVRNFFRKNN
jgi:hypothetical protein